MAEPIVIDLPHGESLTVDDDQWTLIASANWNRLEDEGGYIQWTQGVRQHADGRTLVYVVFLPTSGILKTAGEILPPGSDAVPNTIYRLAEEFDVPTNVPHLCAEGFRRCRRG
jgi:hypothetical protein